MKTIFKKIDVKTELPPKDWRGFVITESSGIEFKRIATYLTGINVWVDGNFYTDEIVTHWLKEINN